ncbi:MAG: hypothetical protein HZB16_10580, partial [Armatimonadetes bacterium]|nr:hypothetical protein [Armatimonadota bacterium]
MRAIGLCLMLTASAAWSQNLLVDPSIEQVQQPNQFGVPYAKWGGWKFEGDCRFAVGRIAHQGQTSALLVGGQGAKLRVYTPTLRAEPGRYRFTCWLRGLDLGVHAWGMTLDFAFADEKYMGVKKPGTFGWTKVELVREVKTAGDCTARIGLFTPGRLWVDEASVEKVPDATPITDAPVFGTEEKPIEPPGRLDPARAVACGECGYRNLPEWKTCYACGETLTARAAAPGPPVKPLASFEDGKAAPFDGGGVAVAENASDGKWSMRVDKDWASWEGAQDWTGYDFLDADVFNPNDAPQEVGVEVRDALTDGYWTRVNYNSVAPPGRSTLRMPTDIYVGEKSRPGRPLDKARVTRLVYIVGQPARGLFIDNIRLTRDDSADRVQVPGLRAFDFAPSGPAFRGFELVTPGTQYSAGRGYGFKDARIWRAFDVLQPDPLYQTFICVEAGQFAVDVPDGTYHVFINLDSPSGFWGEVQLYRRRQLRAEGKTVVDDRLDRDSFAKRYYRFADTEDRLDENTFDKYQKPYFGEKAFDVEVTDGQLNLEFEGENWAHCVSALVLYPAAQAEAGQRYLANLVERRRAWFDNYFKRIPPRGDRDADGLIPSVEPTPAEQTQGFVLFARDIMRDVPCNARPRRAEVTDRLSAMASAGELEPIVFSVYPLRDLGPMTVSVGDLKGPGGTLPASVVRLGVVSHRVSRVTMEGTVYTIEPRYVMPRDTTTIKAGTTSTFWLTLVTPNPVKAGTYTGEVTLKLGDKVAQRLPLSVRLFATPLAELDMPVGPWGCTIDLPWYGEDLGSLPRDTYRRCLARMREAGLTSFSGVPRLNLTGWDNGKPKIDFGAADQQMADAKAAGFRQLLVNYGSGIGGFDNYFVDQGAAQRGGFTDYSAFVKAVLAAIDQHAAQAGWLPVAYNLCDEPIGEAVDRSSANAEAWRKALPADMLTTGATSMTSPKPDDPHLRLSRALSIANLNGHDEAAIKAIHDAGG